ncbi:MAG: GMC family oxidoreductase N-terminal domain-containing protein [Pseudomonadota bacterium]
MYDVLIVGAGSAGSAVAARVSENPNLSVALVEAGPDYPLLADTPDDLVNSHNNSYRDHDWGFAYAPTRHRQDRFPRGKVVGGSSAVNTTIALRGMPEDYDEWADLGNPGWSWDAVLPAFKRLERDLDYPDAPYHGDSGPITIRRYPPAELLPQHQAFIDAAQQFAYPYCADANDPEGWGVGPHPMNKLARLRISAAVGYLAPIRLRPNLSILADTIVQRVLIEGGKARGVEVLRDGEVQQLQATLVILCGGALMTPKVLLCSGIGARDEVDHLGVELTAELPGVGKNLSDHPALAVVCEVRDASLIDFSAPIIQSILRYTAPGSDKRNDLQIEQISFAGRPGGVPQFLIAPVLEYQYGRGQLTLDSVSAAPQLDNRFCEDERDCRRLADCVEDTLRFTREGAIADMISSVSFPDPAKGNGRADIEQLCQKFAGSGYHPCGTAKMGPHEDEQAVVDPRGRCHKVDQLVVADASIMPFVPRANTNLTCFMIGEQIGEWIRTQPAEYGL